MIMVPPAWTRMIGNLRVAQVARDTLRSPITSQMSRDLATVTYSRAVDLVIDDLNTLSEQQVLGRVTMFLARKERG